MKCATYLPAGRRNKSFMPLLQPGHKKTPTMKRIFYSTLTLCLFTCTRINAQTAPVSQDTLIAANKTYAEAGFVKRLFLGDHYREEWATPVKLQVLNMDSFAGGLTVIKAGGGHQTKSLRLKGADGKEYVLRSVNKDPSKALPAEFAGTFAADVVQDQISSSNPYAPLAVAGLAEAAGIFHTTPEIVFVPASVRLDQFSADFANTVCLLEERPSGNEQANTSIDNASNIINSEKLFEKLMLDNTQQVDQKAFLKARLFDMWIGDWDRHQDQWVWASFKEGPRTIYKPVPRDRDQAFAKLDGILPLMASKPWAVRMTKNFDYKIHDIAGLNMGAALLDHTFLTALSSEEWKAIARELQTALTDKKIEEAFESLPKEIYEISAKEIIGKLKARRDNLIAYAQDYYCFLSKEVNVTGSFQKELFEVTRLDDDRTKVSVYGIRKNAQARTPVYERVFNTAETKEIRLYGFNGDDQFSINGTVKKGILVRVIGGPGKDSLTDHSIVKGWSSKTKMYDNDTSSYSSGAEAKKYISQDSLKNKYTKALFKYDWFAPKFSPGYNPDDGLYIGGGIIIKKQKFGKAPYGYMQSLWGNYAAQTGAYNFWYEGIFKEVTGKWDLHLNAQWNAPDYVLNYYGAGNETVKYDQPKNYYRVRANEWTVAPSLSKQFGKNNSLGLGLSYQSVKIERSDSRFITDIIGKLDSGIFKRKDFAALNITYQYNTTDNKLYPKKGMQVNTKATFTNNLTEANKSFVTLSSDASLFVSKRSFTLALRAGAATNTGDDYEFYQSNSLGGSSNLRGYNRSRFSGKTSLYQNTELRYKFSNVNGYFYRGNWGLLTFLDNGRVWVPGESSDKWHIGYGGGFWFLPYNKVAFTATYSVSREEKLVNIKAGFFF